MRHPQATSAVPIAVPLAPRSLLAPSLASLLPTSLPAGECVRLTAHHRSGARP